MKAGQFIAVSLCAVAAATSAQARITRISITKVELPAFDGRAFGGVGQYEKLVGRANGEVDPSTRATRSSRTSSLRRETRAAWSRTKPTS